MNSIVLPVTKLKKMKKTFWSFRIIEKHLYIFAITFSEDDFFPFKKVSEFILEYRNRPLKMDLKKGEISKIRTYVLREPPSSIIDIIQISEKSYEYLKKSLDVNFTELIQ